MRVMLFGDSHLAAVRNGLDQFAAPEEIEFEFWGTPGHRFRHISWRDGKIVPDDAETAAAFSRFNQSGLCELDPAQFDAVVFVGARIRPGAVIPDLLNHVAHPTRHLTREYMRQVLAEHYLNHSTYQMARAMAATRKTRVLMNMVSFETLGKTGRPRAYKVARQASSEHVALMWDLTRQILDGHGITFVAQPVETVVEGYYTKPEYGLAGKDAVHKNPAYGAMILREIIRTLDLNRLRKAC